MEKEKVSYLVEHMTGWDFQNGGYRVALLAVGATENHGNHLPFCQDTFVSYELAKRVAAQVPGVCVLPPIYYGMSEHYQHLPFSASVRYETQIAVLRDILESCYRWGLKRILIINGHDGNIAPIEVASREFKVAHPDAVVAVLEKWWDTAGRILPPDTFDVWNGLGHAGEGEASIALHLFPHLVDMDKAAGVVPDLPEHVEIKWSFDELTPNGATGDPTKGTAEKGRLMVEALTNLLVDFLKQMEEKDWRYGLKAGS